MQWNNKSVVRELAQTELNRARPGIGHICNLILFATFYELEIGQKSRRNNLSILFGYFISMNEEVVDLKMV